MTRKLVIAIEQKCYPQNDASSAKQLHKGLVSLSIIDPPAHLFAGRTTLEAFAKA